MRLLPFALLTLIIFTIVSSSDVIYFYPTEMHVSDVDVINIYSSNYTIFIIYITQRISIRFINVESYISPSYNLSIHLTTFNLNGCDVNTDNISFNVPYSSKLYLIPIKYTISNTIKQISLIFNNIQFNLVNNGNPQNETFQLAITRNYYNLNVSYLTSNKDYYASILLMAVINIKGVNYVYFWNITINSITMAHPHYESVTEYQLDLNEIINILNTLQAG
ncbi:hypothetical protein BFU36_11220 [Sulfolobus sp. A20]|uniref:hypothetical protein n=1 Tax=Sulfolobaceae TaxID=118883 RepID=UPI000845D863|nr:MULTISPECIES: hypothetical protein [unclassified Sulfolobus]TRM76927.1 hypothetical protein DJ523_00050 [Sulfolobus sp. E5]TRM84117.1 hypothetical protein DJ522_05390 [Sulfolobus sp. F3]TRM87185.1 hypothetical protein DJ521_04075 [Sulfolobus sp. E3]TRM88234.1 hypothetical protein DJ529_05880 [Sulfolobus sp. C3]AOL17181.1 hypothetical protein BFU36_11220 [Sulfolobus sp. A20]